MLRFFIIPASLLLLLSCNGENESSSDSDEKVDLSDSTFEQEAPPSLIATERDTAIFQKSKFEEDQLILDKVYLYYPQAVELLNLLPDEPVVFIESGTDVELLGDIDMMYRDSLGYICEYSEIKVNGKQSYLPSHFLGYLPYPTKDDRVESYFFDHLNLIDSARCKYNPNPAWEGAENDFMTCHYSFENNISLSIFEGYESYSSEVSIPNMNVVQGYLFLHKIALNSGDTLSNYFNNECPSVNYSRDYYGSNSEYPDEVVTVEEDNKGLTLINIHIGDGCFYSWAIEKNGSGIILRYESGC